MQKGVTVISSGTFLMPTTQVRPDYKCTNHKGFAHDKEFSPLSARMTCVGNVFFCVLKYQSMVAGSVTDSVQLLTVVVGITL